jgi:uncharacterized protein YukE
MNIEEVRALASQLTSSASEVQSIASKLTSKLSSTTWVGQDRTQFESEWTSTHAQNLNRVVEALNQAAAAANRNAADQQTVSNS